MWDTQGWDFAKVPLDVRTVIANRLCSKELPGDDFTVEQFLFWTIRQIQNFWDASELFADKVEDPKTGKPCLISSYGDGVIVDLVLQTAVQVTNLLLLRRGRKMLTVNSALENLVRDLDRQAMGLTSRALLRNTSAIGIPWSRTLATNPFIRLGYGARKRFVQGPVTDSAGFVGANYSKNKSQTLLLLSEVRLPTGEISVARDVESAVAAAKSIGFPVALKAVNIDMGQAVWAKPESEAEVRKAAGKLVELRIPALVQSHFPGEDHRILVVGHKFVAAARRKPAGVAGDGQRTISQLIARENENPDRGSGHTRLLNIIEIDENLLETLHAQSLSLETVPDAGVWIRLRNNANISKGGTSEDVTHVIHPDNIRMAETISRQLAMEVAAVDFITPDISVSWQDSECGICEVNFCPGMRPHWNANPDQDVTKPILDLMFPDRKSALIPTAMVTGTNGKATTSLMLKSILGEAGHVVGAATTDGVLIDGDFLVKGDVAGVSGASFVLSHPDVTAAVLETARGGIIKRGLAVPSCDVAALLNIQREQIGIDGIETADDMLNLKRKVTDVASKAVVLNADDARTRQLIRDYPKERVIAFTLNNDEPVSTELEKSGIKFIKTDQDEDGEKISLVSEGALLPIVHTKLIPATMNCAHRGNVANAMAAAALAIGMGISLPVICKGLKAYRLPKFGEPGRMIWVDGYPFQVLMDFGANAGAYEVVVEALSGAKVEGQRVCMFTGVGNRPDWVYEEAAASLAPGFDRFICFERPDYVRTRQPAEISSLLQSGLEKAGIKKSCIHACPDVNDAVQKAAEVVKPGDLLAMFGGSSDYLYAMLKTGFGEPKPVAAQNQ